ncbi:DUF6289 family protein [Nonomuraea sp. SYSU D8015]|uniref:DUF6289 family protein n=1 Tax=Nonomuraea sp. SYSU D8015 TaxID=2593644 RepID=UPI001660783B|nr:DUF6289 family protein [Nonomuraea sp. SYSU D8015]
MIRRVLVATLLAAATVAAVTSSPAAARACKIDHVCYTVYYSDSSRTTVVGELVVGCDGERSMWGTRTGFYDFSESPC